MVKRKNTFVCYGNTVVVTDVKGNSFICDLDDWEKYNKYYWFLSHRGYIVTGSKDANLKERRFHRLCMKPDGDMVVDHINRNKLDNRKQNLRIVTQHENVLNSNMKSTNKSGYPGVHHLKNANKWEAAITRNYHKYYLGIFDCKEDAIKARIDAEKLFNGEPEDV